MFSGRLIKFGEEVAVLTQIQGGIIPHKKVSELFTFPYYAMQLTPGQYHETIVRGERTSHLAAIFSITLETGKVLNVEEAKQIPPYDPAYNMALSHGIQDYHIAVSHSSTYNKQIQHQLPHFPDVLCHIVNDYAGFIGLKWYPGDLRPLKRHNPSHTSGRDEMTNCLKVIFSKTIVMDPGYPQVLPFILEDLYAIQKLRNNLEAVIENKDYKLCDNPINELKNIINTGKAIFPEIFLIGETNSVAEHKLDAAVVARVLRKVIETQLPSQIENIMDKIDLQIKKCNRLFNKNQLAQLKSLKKVLGGFLLTTIPNYLAREEQIARMPNFFRPKAPSMIMTDAMPKEAPKPAGLGSVVN